MLWCVRSRALFWSGSGAATLRAFAKEKHLAVTPGKVEAPRPLRRSTQKVSFAADAQ
jgi:hypothetical protein